MKKYKYFAVLMTVAILFTALPWCIATNVKSESNENLGSVTECVIDKDARVVFVRGSIKHSVLVSNRESKLAVYRFDPWANIASELHTAEPIETMDMTIRFEFELSCNSISQRLALYAVAIIDPNGEKQLISDPQYADYYTSGALSAGFKAVITEDVAGAVASHPGSAVIDIYLDKLDKGNKSGYIYNADGELFYFDREVIKDLDKKVMSYTAAGTNVFFRFLISGDSAELPFCTGGNLWASNKCVVVGNKQALNAIYAYTNFLISRYDGAKFGKVEGIILGRGCDMPVLYNYASLVSEDYETVYARSLALIGLAAIEAVGDGNISLIVPVGDTLTENGRVYAADFLESVAIYIENHTELSFTVMCESRHNPYKLDDSDFSAEIDPDDTGEEDFRSTEDPYPEPETENTEESETSEYLPSETVTGEETIPEVTDQTEEIIPPVVTEPEETEKLNINKDSDGYFCTDNINTFLNFFNLLKKKYSSVNDNFCWCWYPDSNTVEGALGACYAYNYIKLASVGAAFYAICFETDVSDRFLSISHLFKYIDTQHGDKETAYAKSAFGISDWSEIIDNYSIASCVYHRLNESSLQANVMDYIGTIEYFNYTSGRGNIGWFDGMYCDSLSIHNDGSESYLCANMDLDAAGVNHAEIGYLFDTLEPLMMGDALTFEVKCGEDDGSLYEITIHLCGEDGTIVSKAVMAGGARSLLSLDVSDYDNTYGVGSMKISLKRVTGSGSADLNLYRVLINSNSKSDEQLEQEFENIREYLRYDAGNQAEEKSGVLGASILVLTVVGLGLAAVAFINDKRNGISSENEERFD